MAPNFFRRYFVNGLRDSKSFEINALGPVSALQKRFCGQKALSICSQICVLASSLLSAPSRRPSLSSVVSVVIVVALKKPACTHHFTCLWAPSTWLSVMWMDPTGMSLLRGLIPRISSWRKSPQQSTKPLRAPIYDAENQKIEIWSSVQLQGVGLISKCSNLT